MGKTTLGTAVPAGGSGSTPDLAAGWQPVAFYEESYDVGNPPDFWTRCSPPSDARHGRPASGKTGPRLAGQGMSETPERLAAYALAALLDSCRSKRKAAGSVRREPRCGLRATARRARGSRVTRHPDRASGNPCCSGPPIPSSNAIRGHREPFYEFFRLFILEGLGPGGKSAQILETLTDW